MKPDIREKISQLLLKGIETEAEVVYLLCQLRKLSEDESGKSNLPEGLAFYADWALHSMLDRSASLRGFLRGLDESMYDYLNGGSLSFKFFEDLSFDTLYEEILDYLLISNIDPALLDEDNWLAFSKLYREVILDCPLILKIPNPKMVKNLKLTANDCGKNPFEWHITLINNLEGREKLRVQLNIVSNRVKGWTVYLD